LCVSQALVPAARLHINLGSMLPASDIAVLASEQSRNGQVPCGQEVRTCLNIKLAQIRLTTIEPSHRGSRIFAFPRNASARMIGSIPAVPTPPPRTA